MDAWYYARDNKQQGPVTREELRRLIVGGSVRASDYVWTEGMTDWQTAAQAPELAPPAAEGAPRPAMPMPARPETPAASEVPNYLVWAIVATVCCCMPGGIVSIVFAVQANSLRNSGQTAEALIMANRARTWIIVSMVVGLAVNLVTFFASFLPAFTKAFEAASSGKGL